METTALPTLIETDDDTPRSSIKMKINTRHSKAKELAESLLQQSGGAQDKPKDSKMSALGLGRARSWMSWSQKEPGSPPKIRKADAWIKEVDTRDKTINKLTEEIKKLAEDIRKITEENSTLKNEIKTLNSTHDHQMQKETQETQQAVKKSDKLRTENSNLIQKLHSHELKSERLQQMVKSLEDERKKLRGEISDLKEKVHAREADIRGVQSTVFQQMDGDSWVFGDDQSTLKELTRLRDRIGAWAKKYAINSLSELESLEQDNYVAFWDYLCKVVRLPAVPDGEKGKLPAQLVNSKRAPAVCLEASLIHHIYTNIMRSPFFVLENQVVLQELYEGLQKVNPKEAHAWRSKMLRLLFSPAQTQEKQGSQRVSLMDVTVPNYVERRVSICKDLSTGFWQGQAKSLVKTMDEDAVSRACEELEKLVQSAGEMSQRIWSRKVVLDVLTLEELKDRPFEVTSTDMEAHPLCPLEDEEDDSCDGQLPLVVVHPAVQVFGNNDGEYYNTSRVWMKARIWLDQETQIDEDISLSGDLIDLEVSGDDAMDAD